MKEAVRSLFWILSSLVVIDILINVVFAYPSDPKRVPSTLQLYFDYGRSVEGKLRRETRANPAETAPITLTGWYDPLEAAEPRTNPEKQIVTIYGMSHAVRLGQALNRVSNLFAARIVGAPGATTNWSYGAYLRDRGGGKNRAVVLAFMSANFMAINTMSSMTWNVDMPAPYIRQLTQPVGCRAQGDLLATACSWAERWGRTPETGSKTGSFPRRVEPRHNLPVVFHLTCGGIYFI
jgi:hypothetical protein